MSEPYVSPKGLSHFLSRLKEVFSELGHKHTKSEITDWEDLAVDALDDGDGNITLVSSSDTNSSEFEVYNDRLDAMVEEILALRQATITDGTGEAYTVTINGITELKEGLTIRVVPHITATSTLPTLDVNGLGATNIFRKNGTTINLLGGVALGVELGSTTNLFMAGSTYTLTYTNLGNYGNLTGFAWIMSEHEVVRIEDLSDIIPVEKGGIGRSSLTAGSYLIGAGTRHVMLKTPEEVLSNIGAATETTYTASVGTSWSASDNYYYQDIVVSGITENDNPLVDILCGSDNAANLTYNECICKVFRITTSADSIRIWATEAISTEFPIQLKVVR